MLANDDITRSLSDESAVAAALGDAVTATPKVSLAELEARLEVLKPDDLRVCVWVCVLGRLRLTGGWEALFGTATVHAHAVILAVHCQWLHCHCQCQWQPATLRSLDDRIDA